jgi:hypothetical protein
MNTTNGLSLSGAIAAERREWNHFNGAHEFRMLGACQPDSGQVEVERSP